MAVSNEFGCFSPESDPITIKVNPLPTPPSIIAENRTTFCEGDQVGLRVENLYQVEWNTGETTKRIVVKQSGNYAARIVDEIGCQSPFSGVVRIEAKTLPPTPTLQKVGIYTLQVVNDVPSSIYSWRFNGQSINEITPSIKASQVGIYTVTASIQHSPTLTCTSKPSADFNFVLEPSSTGLGIYPNPSIDGKVTVETLENLVNPTLIIYDLTGKPIFNTALPTLNGQVQFDFSFLPVGTYYIQVNTNTFKQGQKIVIQAP
ncbi:MAG: T9SS type A sorting domain-containing protein [Spirosomataceae bacterium]